MRTVQSGSASEDALTCTDEIEANTRSRIATLHAEMSVLLGDNVVGTMSFSSALAYAVRLRTRAPRPCVPFAPPHFSTTGACSNLDMQLEYN